MIERGKVTIVPDENQILLDEYTKEIKKTHLEAFIDFSNKFKLGYNFTRDDYQYAPEQLARDGHLILKTIEDQKTAIFYIPKVVTNRQIEWFEYNKFELLHNDLIGAFSINSDKEKSEQIYGLSEINKEIRRKNILYRKEVENHVGKKI